MAGRIAYYGNIATQGLVLNLDAAIQGSYPKTGSTWFDISNNGNNGTLTNGPLYTGSNYGAITFDGVDDYVDTPYTTPIGLGNFSYNTWVNFTSSQLGAIIVKRIGSPTFEQFSLVIAGDSNGSITGSKFVFNDVQNLGNLRLGITSGSYNDGRWHNVTLTRTSTTTTMYVEGAPTVTVTSAPLNLSTATKLFIGRSGDNQTVAGIPFSGSLSLVQAYNQALSQFQVWQNFNAYKSRYGIPDIVTDGLVLNLDAGNPYSYLSGSSGTTWTDTSGVGNNGTLTNGASYANGAISFDGVNDYVKVPSSSQFLFNTGDSITVESWVKCTNIDAREYQAFFTIGGNPSVDRDRLIQMRVSQYTNYGYVDMLHRNSDNTQWHIYRTSNIVVTENEWIHIVGTLTYGNGSTWKIYINGNLVTSEFRPGENGNADPIQPSDTSIYLGPEDGSTGGEYFTGNISVSRLYQKALSSTEITQNFNALRGRYGI